MNREELISKMMEQGNGKSKLSMRSESIQDPVRVQRIPSLKKALKKKSKLLLVTELAIPFDPQTGAVTEEFNVDSKWRPAISATSAALIVKGYANENPELKEILMRRAGVTEWDTSDLDTFTSRDKEVFAKYRVPRIFTVPVVHINIPVMTKNDFGRDYAISVQRDPNTGEVIGEVPGVLKVNKFFREKLYLEVQEYNSKIESGELKRTEQQAKEERGTIYRKNPVSEERPSNWVQMIEIPLTNKYEVSADFSMSDIDAAGIKGHVVVARKNKAISEAIQKYLDGGWEKFDRYFDYFEIDMGCPTEGDENSQAGKQQIGLDTTFEKPSYELMDCAGFEHCHAMIREYLDETMDIEEEVRRSIFISPYTQEVEDLMFSSLETVIDLEHDKYITQEIIMQNKEVISLIFKDKAIELIEEIDAGVSDLGSGDVDTADADAAAKKYDLNSAEFMDSESVSVDELEI